MPHQLIYGMSFDELSFLSLARRTIVVPLSSLIGDDAERGS